MPEELAEKLPAIAERVQDVLAYGGMLEQVAAKSLRPLIAQSQNLAQKFDCVVANPPYMGSKGMNTELKEYARRLSTKQSIRLVGAELLNQSA